MSKKYYIEVILVNGEKITLQEQNEELITSLKASIERGAKKWLSDGDLYINLDYVKKLKFIKKDVKKEDDNDLEELTEWLKK